MGITTGGGVNRGLAPKLNLLAIVGPTASDDITKGYTEGSVWVDNVTNTAYTCVEDAPGAAIWIMQGSASGGAGVFTTLSSSSTTTLAAGTTIGGSQVQPLDATLTALAGLATGVDQVPYSTGIDTFSQATLTPFARTLLDDPDAATARATLQIPDTSSLSGRNKIINGKMTISQRGTSFAAVATNTYTLDRWTTAYATTAAMTVSQSADVPPSLEFQNSLSGAVTTADAAVAAGEFSLIIQTIEGFNIRDLIGRTFTVSLWVRSAKVGIHCLSFRNSAADRSYVSEYSILVANTWEKKTITVAGGLPVSGTWNYTTGAGLLVQFVLMAGSATYTTPGAWQVGYFLATSSQVNVVDTVGNIFAVTGVQLELGAAATPFEHRHYGAELALCQRYFYKATNPLLRGVVFDSFSVSKNGISHPTTMRAAPTVTSFGTLLVYDGTTIASVTAVTAAFSTISGFEVNMSPTSAGLIAGRPAIFYIEAGVGGFDLSSEL